MWFGHWRRNDGGGVIYRLPDVADTRADEARSVERSPDHIRIAERKRIGHRRSGRRGARERAPDRHCPFIGVECLPHDHRQTPAMPQGARQIGKRSGGIDEKHRAEPADHDVEFLRPKWMNRRIPAQERHIAEPTRIGKLPRSLDDRCGNIHAQHCQPLPGAPLRARSARRRIRHRGPCRRGRCPTRDAAPHGGAEVRYRNRRGLWSAYNPSVNRKPGCRDDGAPTSTRLTSCEKHSP